MDARQLIRRFSRAVAAGDEVSARALCAPGAWRAQANGLYQLFRQLHGRGRHLTLRPSRAARVSESARAVIQCAVIQPDGVPTSGLVLLSDHIPRRLTGWTRSVIFVERYLAGIVPADLGHHSLMDDDPATARARALADDLLLAPMGDEHARHRLEYSVHATGSEPAVLGYLQMRQGAGAYLDVVRASRLDVLERVAVQARLAHRGHGDRAGAREDIWLYAETNDVGELRWLAHRAVFDIDALLG